MTIMQAYEAIYKAARKAPLDAESHELVKTCLHELAKYIVEKEKLNEPKAEVSGVHTEQRANPHQSDV